MSKEIIPYEESLALRELGFDEESLFFFSNKIDNPIAFKNKNITNQGIDYLYVELNQSRQKGFSAPLYQQAFRWFREEYNLEIILRPDSINDESKKLREYVIISYDKSWKLEEILEPSHWIRKGCFVTYEKAELECLKKLIEIVKKNKI